MGKDWMNTDKVNELIKKTEDKIKDLVQEVEDIKIEKRQANRELYEQKRLLEKLKSSVKTKALKDKIEKAFQR